MILKTLLLYQSGILRILNSLRTNGILKRVICHFRAKNGRFSTSCNHQGSKDGQSLSSDVRNDII